MENSAVDVIVIGGGILGATLSRELALGGADVVLVDPDDAPNRVSVGSLAWLNASSTANPEYAALRVASMRLWREMKAAHPDCPITLNGSLIWGDHPSAIDAHVTRMQNAGWPAQRLDKPDLTEMAPALNAPPAALFSPL